MVCIAASRCLPGFDSVSPSWKLEASNLIGREICPTGHSDIVSCVSPAAGGETRAVPVRGPLSALHAPRPDSRPLVRRHQLEDADAGQAQEQGGREHLLKVGNFFKFFFLQNFPKLSC